MKLTVLGSGSTIPHPMRSSSAYWLETEGGSILLDCSATAPHRMAEEGLDWQELDAIWISHFHMDHCGGLGPFLAGTKHAESMQTRTKPLEIFGAEGLYDLVAKFSDVHNYRLLEQPFPIQIIEIEAGQYFEILPGVEAEAFKTPHTDQSHAIRLNGSNSLVYSADTGFFEPLADFAKNTDLFILECTFLRDKPVEKHLELAEAMYLIEKAEPKRAMLTHFYPEWNDVDFVEEVERFAPVCNVIEASDGLRITID